MYRILTTLCDTGFHLVHLQMLSQLEDHNDKMSYILDYLMVPTMEVVLTSLLLVKT